ncbi:hypothetical protein [Nonomuraea fuscirosea]|uniref:hypothetical protein n=1 Tax=Nonomuraea fuscirosea TaxID=1291556 RepID=UPI003425D372
MSNSVAFMVMPFGRKPTGRVDDGVPAVVDFDARWERVHEPLLTELGYRAIRADSDLGALVIVQMIQRLALADVVMADGDCGEEAAAAAREHMRKRLLERLAGPSPVFEAPPGFPQRRSTRATWSWRAIWWHRSADGA